MLEMCSKKVLLNNSSCKNDAQLLKKSLNEEINALLKRVDGVLETNNLLDLKAKLNVNHDERQLNYLDYLHNNVINILKRNNEIIEYLNNQLNGNCNNNDINIKYFQSEFKSQKSNYLKALDLKSN